MLGTFSPALHRKIKVTAPEQTVQFNMRSRLTGRVIIALLWHLPQAEL
jgi:hypothetical protein